MAVAAGSGFRGVICDPLGFEQHTGECWIDTIQELLFNTDGLKDITQPLFYNMTNRDIYGYVDRSLGDENIYGPDIKIIDGIKAIRDRFKSHYNFIHYHIPPECRMHGPQAVKRLYKSLIMPGEPAALKRQESRNHGISIAQLLGPLPGHTTGEQIYVIWAKLFKIFNIPYTVKKINNEKIGDVIAYGIGMRLIYLKDNYNPGTDKPAIAIDGHATGFFKCNDQWQYYNDNSGLYPVTKVFVDTTIGLLQEKLKCICLKEIEDCIYLFTLANITKEGNEYIFSDEPEPDEIFIDGIFYDFSTLLYFIIICIESIYDIIYLKKGVQFNEFFLEILTKLKETTPKYHIIFDRILNSRLQKKMNSHEYFSKLQLFYETIDPELIQFISISDIKDKLSIHFSQIYKPYFHTDTGSGTYNVILNGYSIGPAAPPAAPAAAPAAAAASHD